jgi:hypothetical protein
LTDNKKKTKKQVDQALAQIVHHHNNYLLLLGQKIATDSYVVTCAIVRFENPDETARAIQHLGIVGQDIPLVDQQPDPNLEQSSSDSEDEDNHIPGNNNNVDPDTDHSDLDSDDGNNQIVNDNNLHDINNMAEQPQQVMPSL